VAATHSSRGGSATRCCLRLFGTFDLEKPFGRSKYTLDGPVIGWNSFNFIGHRSPAQIAESSRGRSGSNAAAIRPKLPLKRNGAPQALVGSRRGDDPETSDYLSAINRRLVAWLLDRGGIRLRSATALAVSADDGGTTVFIRAKANPS